jgi:hypothetical protein
VLKKTRWCVLKRRANLTGQQRFRLRDLLRYNLQTVRAYLLKEDFQQFWEYESPSWAGKFLDDGFRTFHVTETALYHALGKLPEPDVAHKFFLTRHLFRCLVAPFGTFSTSKASKSSFEMISRTMRWQSGCRSILAIALRRTMWPTF